MDKENRNIAVREMITKICKSIGNFFRKDTWLKVISLVFAVILWGYVIADANPTRQMTLSDVPVTYTGITELREQGLTVEIDDLVHVTDLKISAGQDSHKNISTNNVKAFVDFSGISEPDTYTLPIQTSVSIAGASVNKMSPGTVTVVVEELAERRVPVECRLEGTPADGYFVDTPKMTERHIVISGPKSKVEQVTRAVAVISVDGISEDVSNSYTVQLTDIDGKVVKLNTVGGEIPSVIVDLDVLKIKTIELDVEEIKNSITDVAENYEVVNISLNSNTVEIVGEEELLAQIDKLAIKSISAENADKGKILQAELQSIQGIRFPNGNVISFYAQIEEKTTEKKFENVAIRVMNTESSYTAVLSEMYTDIVVRGGISAMSNVQREDIKIYVDLAGQKPGSYVLPVKVEDLAGIDISEVTLEHASVSVEIK